ncbi:serine hydrolase [Acidovorax sp. A1169]|uniref:serine hydrolase n=1 Tax=Acidovorax sp. A1169 TaxID=3059524 RepID=UPI0027379D15|nr:serine hydrolase [Acidovorax sp. A1169]MDP4075430.1 serine hydrolase [Acidovorax sp. A1169]
MTQSALPLRAWCTALILASASLAAQGAAWSDALRQQIEKIDQATPGQLGVYVKRLDNGEVLSYQADRPWYLGSSAKLPVAIALLQEVEQGKHSLAEQVTLQDSDKVDGSGNVVWNKAGTRYRLDALLKRMLMESDNTAANMLIRTIGDDTLNRRARDLLGTKGFERITDFTQVRYDVYAELHPGARKMANMDLVRLAAAPMGDKRVETLARTIGVDKADLRVKTMDEAYKRYYARGLNSAPLTSYGGMLEKLVTGKLLSPAHQQRLFTDLKYATYDAYRLEAGLPRSERFIHKTGTQLHRACHMGVVNPQDGGRAAIVLATCAEDLDEHGEAGKAFEQIGRALTQTFFPGKKPGR